MCTEVTNARLFASESHRISASNVAELEAEYFNFTFGKEIKILDKIIYVQDGELVMVIYYTHSNSKSLKTLFSGMGIY